MRYMCLERGREYDDVVNVNQYERKVSKEVGHYLLKHSREMSKSKWRTLEAVLPALPSESGAFLVRLLEWKLVESSF